LGGKRVGQCLQISTLGSIEASDKHRVPKVKKNQGEKSFSTQKKKKGYGVIRERF